MLIANPIYDSVFKYLLEDTDVARGFLATILGEEIISIEVKPQETTAELASHKLSYASEVSDPLVKKMVERLTRAIADEDLRRRMDVEDEVDHTIAKLLREKDAIIQEKELALQEKELALQESKEELARRDALIADLTKRLEDGK